MPARSFVFGDRILQRSADTHADLCAGFGRGGRVRVLAASAIGQLHRHDDRPRDDAFLVRTADEWLAVAVSDGIGSQPMSRFGSSCAVEVLCETLLREASGATPVGADPIDPSSIPSPNSLPCPAVPLVSEGQETAAGGEEDGQAEFGAPAEVELPVRDRPAWAPGGSVAFGTLCWNLTPRVAAPAPARNCDLVGAIRSGFRAAHAELGHFAETRSFDVKSLGCTLLGLLLNTETGDTIVGQVGDGLIAWMDRNRQAVALFSDGLSQPGETTSITSATWEQGFRVHALAGESVRTLYLMTDGVADDCLYPPPQDVFQRWANDVDREMRAESSLDRSAERLVSWLATYKARGSWDDRTLAVVLVE